MYKYVCMINILNVLNLHMLHKLTLQQFTIIYIYIYIYTYLCNRKSQEDLGGPSKSSEVLRNPRKSSEVPGGPMMLAKDAASPGRCGVRLPQLQSAACRWTAPCRSSAAWRESTNRMRCRRGLQHHAALPCF